MISPMRLIKKNKRMAKIDFGKQSMLKESNIILKDVNNIFHNENQ